MMLTKSQVPGQRQIIQNTDIPNKINNSGTFLKHQITLGYASRMAMVCSKPLHIPCYMQWVLIEL